MANELNNNLINGHVESAASTPEPSENGVVDNEVEVQNTAEVATVEEDLKTTDLTTVEEEQNTVIPVELEPGSESDSKPRKLSFLRRRSNNSRPGSPKSPKTPPSPASSNGDSISTTSSFFGSRDERANKESRLRRGDPNTIVTVVLIGATGLPTPPTEGLQTYCKFRLGPESYKSKSVPHTQNPEWRERFKLYIYRDHMLNVSVSDKGRQKHHMGSCYIDLSTMEKNRTHVVNKLLDENFGSVRMAITISEVKRSIEEEYEKDDINIAEVKEKFAWYNLKSDWETVGQLHVKVVSAKGLYGKPNAYCLLEVDNERVQTHSERATPEPTWNKDYIFNIYDITSTLDVTVYDNAFITENILGKVHIPLLRIYNGESRWYALKDRSKRSNAKGNCPRILLKMFVVWNPVTASMKLFQPKEVKYIKKPPKFDLGLVYRNNEFVRDQFKMLAEINESFKLLFEWDNKELSALALIGWSVFWFYFRPWTTPLLLLIPFLYNWMKHRNHNEIFVPIQGDTEPVTDKPEETPFDKTLTGRMLGLQDLMHTITKGTEFMASLAERIENLVTFKVPFLSYLTMVLLVFMSVVFYLIPFNYLMIGLGIYKFTRKFRNPERVSNNDILDFISRIPDHDLLKNWKELSVPEPCFKKIQQKE